MSGHSKWSTIKRKKAATDAKKAKLWTKILREVMVSARLGGGDPDANPRLRAAITDARSANVPNDNLDRAIKKGTGEDEGTDYAEVSYEGYGPGGVAVLVEAITDNRNRTVAEIRHLFSRFGGNLGENGCVAWMFDRRGYFVIEPTVVDEEGFLELAIELGAEDFTTSDEQFEMYTSQEDFNRVKDELDEREIATVEHQLAMVPQSQVEVESDNAGSLLRLLEALEDHDDVQNVWANFDLDESSLEAAAG